MARESKTSLRKRMIAMRRSLPDEERSVRNAKLYQRVADYLDEWVAMRQKERIAARPKSREPQKNSAGSLEAVGIYLPFRGEADVTAVMDWCAGRGLQAAVPIVEQESASMGFYPIHRELPLITGSWGILEPRRSDMEKPIPPEAIRLLLVPGAAFDRKGGRLGYGGGYYDRFLAQYPASGKQPPHIVGVAFDFQFLEDIPKEPHDYLMDAVITDRQIFRRNRKNS